MASVRKSVRFGIRLAVVLGLVIPSTGSAQEAKVKKGTPTGTLEIEEITVTAQKREENLQEIPISIIAVTGDTLRERGIANVNDLKEAVPNLYLSSGTGSTQSTWLTMRGVRTGSVNLTVNPAVGMYIDGVYISKIMGANLDLEDIERVEVLRGPQGTLWGKNTIAGAANFVTQKPTADPSILLQTEAGNFDYFKGRVTANVPLIGKNGFFQSDALGTLSLRQTVMYRSRDGFYLNRLPNNVPSQPTPSGSNDYENLNRLFTMTSVRWQPTASITVDYSGEYHRVNNASTMWVTNVVYPGSPVSGSPFNLTPYANRGRADSVATNALCKPTPENPVPNCTGAQRDLGDHRMHLLTGAWDVGELGALGNVTLKSISGYRLMSPLVLDQDLDGSPLHMADFGLEERVEHWSEELQWVGTLPRIKYVFGAYYFGERTKEIGNQWIFAGAVSNYSKNIFKTESIAPFFGQATYTPPILGDRLSVTAGIRYTHDQVHFDRKYRCLYVTTPGRAPTGLNFCNLGIAGLQDFDTSAGRGFGGTDAISPMGDISYQWTDNVMTYFRVSRGFKGGTFNGAATTPQLATVPVDPEKLLSYEAGFKSQWFGNRLRLNADGYYSDYTDMQISVARIGAQTGAQQSLENAGKAEIWGSEVELAAIPLRGLELGVNYGLTLPTFNEYLEQAYDPITGLPLIGKTVNVADQRQFASTPEHTLTVGATYTAPPTSVGTFIAHVDTYWQDRIHLDPIEDHPSQGSYAIVNGRLLFVGIPLQKGSLDVAVFSRNLFDRWYRVIGFSFGQGLGWEGGLQGEPRTFGVQLTYNFTAGEAAPPPPAPVAQAAPPPPPPAKKKIVLRSVHFDFDKATLKAEAKPILDEAMQVLKQEGSVDIIVEGHTDSVGTDQYNLGLSRRRAETVRHYLVDHGVAPSRITAEGLGESKPVASNDTAAGRAQNRRVELHVK